MFRSLRKPGHGGHLSQAEIDRMRNLRAQGWTVGRIHDEMGLNYHTVSRHTKDVVR